MTGLKEAQYSLQISERRFRTLVAGTTALVWQTDSAGNFSAPMPQWEEFTGQRWPAYKGRGAAEAVHPADRDAAAAAWRSALQDGAAYSADFRLWHEPSRSWRHMVARGTPVTGDNGEIIEWIGAMTDDTARRRLEDKLRQSAKMESLGVLAGGVAHDFNNILVGILGNASLLESTIRDPSERDLVQEIVHAGERAATLTQQMLAYSGRGRFVVEVASVAAEIARLEPQLRALLPSHVALSLELDRTVPETEIDRVQIEQLLTNLVVNAAESIEGSSGSITIAARPAILSANADGFALGQHPEAGSYAVIEVRDTGHGMDAATQAKIFDPFFSTRFTGRGLGLPAALGIARGHLGAIRLYSRPGEGATFQVYLPAFTRAVAAARAVGVGETEGRIAEPAIKDSRRSVLIVDDEEVVRSFASSALDRQGFRAIPAESGKRAVEMLRADPAAFAAVLLDLTMPGMSGQQTLAALRAIRPDLPVLASSGYSASDAESQFGGRVEGFIQKPYTPRELADALRQVLALEVISDD